MGCDGMVTTLHISQISNRKCTPNIDKEILLKLGRYGQTAFIIGVIYDR